MKKSAREVSDQMVALPPSNGDVLTLSVGQDEIARVHSTCIARVAAKTVTILTTGCRRARIGRRWKPHGRLNPFLECPDGRSSISAGVRTIRAQDLEMLGMRLTARTGAKTVRSGSLDLRGRAR